MTDATTLYTVLALASLVPAAAVALSRDAANDPRLPWLALALAVIGPTAWSADQLSDAWNAGLSATLWIGIAASMIVFAVVVIADRQAWRLTPLLVPYLFILGLLAAAFASLEPSSPDDISMPWLGLHIAVAVLTLGLLTVAAAGALASHLQARALKAKHPTWISRRLPPAFESDRISARLLVLSEVVLGLGIVSGMAIEHSQTGRLLQPDHKTMMTLAGFAIIALLLAGRRFLGVPGQIVSRLVLLAYLLVILGYFGVKFVHQMPAA